MKYVLLFFMYCIGEVAAQTLGFQSFDAAGWNFTISGISGTPSSSVQAGNAILPDSTSFGKNNSAAFTMSSSNTSSSSSSLTFDALNTTGYPCTVLEFDLQALGLTGSGAGMDATYDRMEVAISLNNGLNFEDQLVIRGRGNAYWSYDSSSVLNLPFSLIDRTDIQMILGAECREEGFGKVRILGIPAASQLVVRFRFYSNRSNELWTVDNVRLFAPIQFLGTISNAVSVASNYSTSTLPADSDWILIDTSMAMNMDFPLEIAGLLIQNECQLLGSDTLRITEALAVLKDTFFVQAPCLLSFDERGIPVQWIVSDGVISGEMGIEYTFSGSPGWRHLTSPFREELQNWLSQLNMQFNAGSNSTIYGFDGANADWTLPLPTDSVHGRGWSVYLGSFVSNLPTVIRSFGEIDFSTQSLAFEGGVPQLNSSAFIDTAGNSGWNFLGNPYPFPISWELLAQDLDFPSNLAKTIYCWNAHDGNYASYNPLTGSVNGGLPWIPAGSGFFVQADPGTSGQITVNPTSHASASVKVSSGKMDLRKQTFEVRNSNHVKRASLVESPDATVGYDSRYDHRNMGESGSEWEVCLSRFRSQYGDTLEYKLKSTSPSDTVSTFLVIRDKGNGGDYEVLFTGDGLRCEYTDLSNASSGTFIEGQSIQLHLNPHEKRLLKLRSSKIDLSESQQLKTLVWRYVNQSIFFDDIAPTEIQFIDLSGNVLRKFQSNQWYSLADLPAGIYLIAGDGFKAEKFIKPN